MKEEPNIIPATMNIVFKGIDPKIKKKGVIIPNETSVAMHEFEDHPTRGLVKYVPEEMGKRLNIEPGDIIYLSFNDYSKDLSNQINIHGELFFLCKEHQIVLIEKTKKA